jgi:hypothetical protein
MIEKCNNFTLILLILIVIYLILNFNTIKEGLRNTMYFDNDANYQYIMDLNKKPCTSYNCNESDVEDQILLVGSDSKNNHIFKFKNNLYMAKEDNIVPIESTLDKNINYLQVPTKVPVDLKNMKLKIKLNLDGYKFIGMLNNNFYNQEYILYEKPYEAEEQLEDKLYYYNLVKIIGNDYKVVYSLPPRAKILPNEYIWASYGSFQIGPLIFN